MSDTSLRGILGAGGAMNFPTSLGNPRGNWSCGSGKGIRVIVCHSPHYVELEEMSQNGSEAASLNFLQLRRDKGGHPVSHGPEGYGNS